MVYVNDVGQDPYGVAIFESDRPCEKGEIAWVVVGNTAKTYGGEALADTIAQSAYGCASTQDMDTSAVRPGCWEASGDCEVSSTKSGKSKGKGKRQKAK